MSGNRPRVALLKGVDIVDPLAGEASFTVQVLVDVGDRGRVRVHAGMPGVDRRETGAIRAPERDPDPRLENPVAANHSRPAPDRTRRD